MSFVDSIRASIPSCIQVAHVAGLSATARPSACSRITSCCRWGKRQATRFHSSAPLQSSLHNLRERSKKQQTLVFQSTSNNPYHNLAIEHFLLTNSDVDSRILLFYTNRPCVVIGRNQNPWTECHLDLIQAGLGQKSIDFVRRRSGGGTVFHDEGNLNFSVIVPNDKHFTRRKHSEIVVRALNKLYRVSAAYKRPEALWVNERHDITMMTIHNEARSEFKVSGSAYKLTRGRALHHGTLLHSSPNLNDISRLLKSPGTPWLHARGVESVRSPVRNLFNVQNNIERDHLRSQIIDVITEDFLHSYNTDAKTDVVGDGDCSREGNPSIADGVRELLTNEWRFDQTPRFDFTGESIVGKQLTFSISNGMIENPRIGSSDIPIQQKSPVELQQQQKIYEIRDWDNIFDSNAIDKAHIPNITQAFPNIQKILFRESSDADLDSGLVKEDVNSVIRRLEDGSIEEESGFNTVEEIKQ